MTLGSGPTILPLTLPRGSEKANEFKRYRQVLAVLYIGAISAGFLLLAASVVKELFVEPTPISSGHTLSSEPLQTPEALASCHRNVDQLYRDLAVITAELLALPGRDRSRAIMPQWEEFSATWLTRWHDAAERCRFAELAGTQQGEVYDRMAQVHGELPAMRLEYQSLIVRFNGRQAAHLARMTRDLNRSRALLRLQKNRGAADEEAP